MFKNAKMECQTYQLPNKASHLPKSLTIYVYALLSMITKLQKSTLRSIFHALTTTSNNTYIQVCSIQKKDEGNKTSKEGVAVVMEGDYKEKKIKKNDVN